MQRFGRTSLLLSLMLLGVFACALPGIPQVDSSAGGTSVAQTVQAIIKMTQDAASNIVDKSSATPASTLTSIPPTSTFTPLPPTWTPTATLTPLPIHTVTPLVPMMSVSVPTNCRVGPGKIYRIVGALLANRMVQIYGRDPGSDYWYIRNPDANTQFCWVWGQYATFTGLISAVPVFTPPPTPKPTATETPEPAFDASFAGLGACAGWWVDIDLTNTGSLAFKSISLTVRDTVTTKVVASTANGFFQRTGCASSVTRKALLPGKDFTDSSPRFAYNITGHKMRAIITLCSDTGLNGTCITKAFLFTP